MEAFTCANSVAEDFGCKSCLNSHCFSSKPLCMGPQQCSYSNAEKENPEVAELEIAFNEMVCVLHVDVNGQLAARNQPNPDGEVCPELKIHLSGSSGVQMQKGLNKCATFPVSEKVQSSKEIPSQSSLKSENPAHTRSLSLPTTLNLVSAMKGGREANGKPMNTARLNVKWAPDVYDPPETSMSHSVRNHHRPKSKKKDHHKHKHKGKSSRGCGSEKKHVIRRSTIGNTSDHLPLRFAPQSSTEILDYSVASSQESKCGGMFLMESLAQVQLSIAEAS